MRSRGSVTILVLLLMPALLGLGFALRSRMVLLHQERSAQRTLERALLGAFRAHDRELFERFGLLGIPDRGDGLVYSDPLGDPVHLEESILALMQGRCAEAVVQIGCEALGEKAGVGEILAMRNDVLETLAIKDAMNRSIESGRVPAPEAWERLVRGVLRAPLMFDCPGPVDYFHTAQIEGGLISLEASDLFAAVQWETLEQIRQLSAPWIPDVALLAGYAVDYLGYSVNQGAVEPFQAEFILTGLTQYRRPLVMAQLTALRSALHIVSMAADPAMRNALLAEAGGDPRLMLIHLVLEAVRRGFSDAESLAEGGEVPIIPGREACKADYRDHLMVLLMTVPKPLLLTRVETAVSGIAGTDLDLLYTRVETQGGEDTIAIDF